MLLGYSVLVFCVNLVMWRNSATASLLDLLAHRLENGARALSSSESRTSVVKPRNVAINLIEKYNYPAESHEVETKDGYLLTVHRIPRPGKPAIILQHGLVSSSDSWLMRGPDQDLAFMLADEGYDVWLNNIRGNIYSRKHVRLNPDTDKEFWNFSFHEMGYYDIPAVVDYILNVTEEKTITYIGHSMGTTIFFVMCSTRPEYNSKITLMHALAPAAFIIHKLSPFFHFLISNVDSIAESCKQQQMYELFPFTKFTSTLGRAFCNTTAPTQPFCVAAVFLFTGVDYPQLNMTVLSNFFDYYPAGASLNTFLHFAGNVKRASFRYMDYGEEENLMRYGNKDPPQYNLKKVTTPIALYYGDGDYIIKQDDTEMLAKHLSNIINVYRVPYRFFNHLDFIIGTDSKYLLYEQILLVTNKYN